MYYIIKLLLLLLSHFSCVLLCATPRTQPTRLPRPWDSPGKNTGVGCHFLLHYKTAAAAAAAKSFQSCLTLCDPMDTAHQVPLSLEFSRQEHWSGLSPR